MKETIDKAIEISIILVAFANHIVMTVMFLTETNMYMHYRLILTFVTWILYLVFVKVTINLFED